MCRSGRHHPAEEAADVGLIASAERIVEIRQNRLLGLNAPTTSSAYVDRDA